MLALIQSAPSRAHAKAQVPERARKFGDQRPEILLGFFVSEKKQQVQVRVREQHLPPVTSQRQQAQSLSGNVAHLQQSSKHFLDRVVRQLTQLPQRLAGARAVL